VASATARHSATAGKDLRDLVTPEGVALPIMLATRGTRALALMLDLAIVGFALFAILLLFVGLAAATAFNPDGISGALELLGVLAVLTLFLARFGYFLWFELGPRAATPGKRIMGIRVAARPDGTGPARLTAEAIIARNLLRDIEVFLPLTVLAGAGDGGMSGAAAALWVLVFLALPFCNQDRLRAGDMVAGTWVVQSGRTRLAEALSLPAEEETGRTAYRFGEAELAIYGEHELQVLEDVLRRGSPESLHEVMEAICNKIGWDAGYGDERAFLEAFYRALRGHLERDLRFGRRKKDKFS